MVTTYQLLCSCGCGKRVLRNIFATGACKVRAYRDHRKQTKDLSKAPTGQFNSGRQPVIPDPVKPSEFTPTTCQVRNFNPRTFCDVLPIEHYKSPKFFKGNVETTLSGWLCNKHFKQVSEAKYEE